MIVFKVFSISQWFRQTFSRAITVHSRVKTALTRFASKLSMNLHWARGFGKNSSESSMEIQSLKALRMWMRSLKASWLQCPAMNRRQWTDYSSLAAISTRCSLDTYSVLAQWQLTSQWKPNSIYGLTSLGNFFCEIILNDFERKRK